MISLSIGNEERKNGNIEERWIAEQFRKRNGQPVCVKMIIREGDVNARFSSGSCSPSGGGGNGPKPNQKERELFKLWDQKGLNGTDINAGMVISFIKQYEKYI